MSKTKLKAVSRTQRNNPALQEAAVTLLDIFILSSKKFPCWCTPFAEWCANWPTMSAKWR